MKESVVVVEDDDLIRDSLVEVLEQHGYAAIGAAHGRDALDKLAALETPPCLIILDIMMPVMDGREFRRLQRQDPRLGKVPVVVISAFRDLEDIARELEPVAHFKKPVKLRDFLQIVETHCPSNSA